MAKVADLHIHTHFSDSTDSPEEVVAQALHHGLGAIAITDHDTVAGIGPTRLAAKPHDLEVLTGVELSSEFNHKDIHILGYCFDENHGELTEKLDIMQNARLERIKKMIELLKGLGVNNIEFDEVCALAQSKSVGRPHLAFVLKQKAWVQSIPEAFEKYIGEGGPAWAPKFKVTPYEAIALIKRAGGVAALAHPMLTQRDELIPSFVEGGLKGLEVYYPNASESARNHYERLAVKHNLIPTGGSDAHGKVKEYTYVGKVKVPYRIVERLKDERS